MKARGREPPSKRTHKADFDHPLVPNNHPFRRHLLYRLLCDQWDGWQKNTNLIKAIVMPLGKTISSKLKKQHPQPSKRSTIPQIPLTLMMNLFSIL
ncbi:hypothetical protein [Zymomonas mobilis]|uniref:hypothetical protein n=1 Tax=Zymomonas mobilis TaxID=542 RepID=UPI00138A2534|nr:hypothetical protein [Zymomonas mobilis]